MGVFVRRGLSLPFGALPPWRAGGAAGARDAPAAPLDLAPALLLDEQVCGACRLRALPALLMHRMLFGHHLLPFNRSKRSYTSGFCVGRITVHCGFYKLCQVIEFFLGRSSILIK